MRNRIITGKKQLKEDDPMNITAAGRNTVLYPIPTKPEKTEKKDNTAGISQPNEPSNVKPGQMDTFTRMTGEPDSAES